MLGLSNRGQGGGHKKAVSALFLCVLAILGTGCSTSYVQTLPLDLTNRLDHTLSFPQLKDSPDSHKGKLVMVGGQILEAKRLKDSTQLIILQLPLMDDQKPSTDLTQSQGRLIATQQEFLDPATVPAGTKVTIIGEVSGSVTQSLDETHYDYPTVAIKHLKVWPEVVSYPYPYPPYYGYPPYYPYPYPFYGPRGYPYGYYPYWYW